MQQCQVSLLLCSFTYMHVDNCNCFVHITCYIQKNLKFLEMEYL